MVGKNSDPHRLQLIRRGGRVFVEGENWSAVSDTSVEPGEGNRDRRGARINSESKTKKKDIKPCPLLEGTVKVSCLGWVPIFILAAIILPQMIRILREYEARRDFPARGNYWAPKGAGT